MAKKTKKEIRREANRAEFDARFADKMKVYNSKMGIFKGAFLDAKTAEKICSLDDKSVGELGRIVRENVDLCLMEG